MSYCRWSTDDFQCDLYCYEDASGGWTTHVAGRRTVGRPPHEDWELLKQGDEGAAKFHEQHKAQMAWLDTCQRETIALPHAGETFNDTTLQEFKARLLSLRAMGYRFPDEVIEEIDDEIKETAP